jgi:hypothetical protein
MLVTYALEQRSRGLFWRLLDFACWSAHGFLQGVWSLGDRSNLGNNCSATIAARRNSKVAKHRRVTTAMGENVWVLRSTAEPGRHDSSVCRRTTDRRDPLPGYPSVLHLLPRYGSNGVGPLAGALRSKGLPPSVLPHYDLFHCQLMVQVTMRDGETRKRAGCAP